MLKVLEMMVLCAVGNAGYLYDYNNNSINNPENAMKLSTLSVTVAAALYSAAALHAASDVPQSASVTQPAANTLRFITAEQVQRLNQRQTVNAVNKVNVVKQNHGLNMAINPVRSKFQPEPDLTGEHVYIVQLTQPAISTHAIQSQPLQVIGAASQPLVGQQKLFSRGQPVTQQVADYQQQLLQTQQQTLIQVEQVLGAKHVRQQFTAAINGFSMSLTQDEAERLSRLPQVASVQRSVIYKLNTDEGPRVINADQVWSGNTDLNLPLKGEGIIVAVLDTGVNTDHPSFAAVSTDGYQHVNPFGAGQYLGDCQKAGFAHLCNDKLIGVRSYPVITKDFGWIAPAVGEDYNGHGSHTASTAAGNTLHDVDFVIQDVSAASDGIVIKEGFFPQISGVAPRANIISYQVCSPLGECPSEALIAGIEDAVTDGADVINFSIGNAGNLRSPWEDAIEQAFLGAFQAGVATAASAGNSGGAEGNEYLGYIDHASPWLVNVGATTHGRSMHIDTTLDNFVGGDYAPYQAIKGGGINDESLTGVVVDAAHYGDADCLSAFAADTFAYALDVNNNTIVDTNGNPAPVIVACQRGNNPRIEKAANVAAGGASGFILYNASDWGDEGNVVYTDRYPIPGIHISMENWWQLSSWLNSDASHGHWLTISATDIYKTVDPNKQDRLASFSSRGPSRANPSLLVPTVSAPGVNIYAASNDENPFAEYAGGTPFTADYAFLSGSSMAAPHVAGALALLKQANPQLSVAQLQSALQLTADPEVVTVNNEGQPWETRTEVNIYRAGTGRINVKNAIDTGLVMDESHANMLAANPNSGGLPHQLNIPQLVNFNCNPTCTWLRTFTATKDGHWEISSDPVVNWSAASHYQYQQNGVKIEAVPSRFSLRAGESQTVMVTASITKTHDIFGNSEVELHSHLKLQDLSGRSPDMRMPVVFKYNAGQLPEKIELNMHAAAGNFPIKGVVLPEAVSPVARVYKAVTPDIELVTLPTDDDGVMPWPANPYYDEPTDQIVDDSVHIRWMTVPEGSKRLVVEVLERVTKLPDGQINDSNLIVYLGKDFDGDGAANPRTEILCASLHTTLNNYCYIDDPEPGEYWAMVYNPNDWFLPGDFTYKVAYAVVTDEIDGSVSIQLPGNTDGVTPTTINLEWNLPEAQAGDIYYSGFDIGSSDVNPQSAGFVPLRLNRGANHISMQTEKTSARIGQRFDLTFTGLPNQSGLDRSFSITTQIPAGLTLEQDAIRLSDDSIITAMSLSDGVLTISGEQPDTKDLAAAYVMTTNQDDAMCFMPDYGQNDPGFIDLVAMGGGPLFGNEDPMDLREGTHIPLSWLFQDYSGLNLYGNEHYPVHSLFIRGNGHIGFSGEPLFWPAHYPFPYRGFPHQAIAPLWRGWGGTPFGFDVMITPFNGWDQGISVAHSDEHAVVQWNGSHSVYYETDPETWETTRIERDDRFNFQMVMNKATRFGKGQYEFYLGYQKLQFNGDGRGSVGIQGFRGLRDPYGPLEGHLGSSFAYEDLDQKLQEGLVICMDYQGPESSQFSVTVPVRVSNGAVGKTLDVTGVATLAGMADMPLQASIDVPGNITVGAIRDYTIDENTTLANLLVLYSDERNTANRISVSGANITAEVHGHTAGSAISITPEAHFFGTTEVTVTVTDMENPSDRGSTTFKLHVININDAPVARVVVNPTSAKAGDNIVLDASGSYDVDGDALSFSWQQQSGASVTVQQQASRLHLTQVPQGNYSFQLTVSDGQLTDTVTVSLVVSAAAAEIEVKRKSSGSATMFSLLGLLALLMLRRRRLH